MHKSMFCSFPDHLLHILNSCFIIRFLKGTPWINDLSHTQSFLEFPQTWESHHFLFNL